MTCRDMPRWLRSFLDMPRSLPLRSFLAPAPGTLGLASLGQSFNVGAFIS